MIKGPSVCVIYDKPPKEINPFTGRWRYRLDDFEDLVRLGWTSPQLAHRYGGILVKTIARERQARGLLHWQLYTDLGRDNICDYIESLKQSGSSRAGAAMVMGALIADGIRAPRAVIRACLGLVDKDRVGVRFRAVTTRRKYHVPWPMSLWHMDGQYG